MIKSFQSLRQSLGARQVAALKLCALTDGELGEAIAREAAENGALKILDGVRESSHYDNEKADRYKKIIEGVADDRETLKEHLRAQLNMTTSPEVVRRAAASLIDNLTSDGYHIIAPALICRNQKILADALSLVQGFDPVGVCTRDVKESLLVQYKYKFCNPLGELLLHHLNLLDPPDPLIVQNKILSLIRTKNTSDPLIHLVRSRILKIHDPKERLLKIESVIKEIQSLDPHPASRYKKDPTPALDITDIIVSNGDLVIKRLGDTTPALSIDSNYFDKGAVERAKRFITLVEYRERAVKNLIKAVVDFQRAFFFLGPCALKPMKQKDIGNILEIDRSSVSRLIRERLIRSKWGLFPLKYFFSNEVGGASAAAIKSALKEIIDKKGGDGHLTDEELSHLLSSGGYKVARRTVNKYRTSMGL